MRYLLAAMMLFASSFAVAGTVNLPAETGAPVNEDDWSIPLHRCIRSTWFGVGVYDGAERCAMAFAIPLDAGRRVLSVRALYEDDDFNSEFEMQFLLRDAMAGGNALVVAGKDNDPSLTVLETMSLEPKHVLAKHDAAFVLIEVRGDTRLISVSYEYE
jgi:hypothetical protein